MSGGVQGVTLVCGLGCALVGGVFFGFSTFVMRGLGQLPAPEGVASMQAINRLAVTPPFMIALFGTALACLVLGGWSVASWDERWAPWTFSGCLAYLIGTVGTTMAGNVPLNDALARVDDRSDRLEGTWQHYRTRWTAWNHLRTVSGLGAALLLAIALIQ